MANSVVQISGTQPITVALAIQTDVATAQLRALPFDPAQPGSPLNPTLPALAFWGPGSLAGLAATRRKKKLSKSQRGWLQLGLRMLLAGALAAGISGCGGSMAAPPPTSQPPAPTSVTPAGASTIIITASPASGSAQSLSLNVTITS